MRNSSQLLLRLLAGAIRGEKGERVIAPPMTDEEIRAVYALAKKHDLAHLVGAALEGAQEQDRERYQPFFNESVRAAYRCQWLTGEQERIFALLEQMEIPYIPLKGAVVRELYREPWHRTSCDIDVLIPEDRLEEAIAGLESRLTYARGQKGNHDVSLTAPNGVHLELHYDIAEKYLDRSELWADARRIDDRSQRHSLSPEMLLLAHFAHMAKHFVDGGCGLRPFLDLWLMRDKLPFDPTTLGKMLETHGLDRFSRTMLNLVGVWFEGKTPGETERMAENYLLPAGVYGSLDNRITVIRAEGRSGFSYAVERIFPPRSSLKIAYPVLEKSPWLLPVCWVRRWFRLIFRGKLRQARAEYAINRRLNADTLQHTENVLSRLGLTP